MIAYHGTNQVAARSIEKTGFRIGSWFALDKRDAIAFGGDIVFVVKFSDDPKHWRGESDGWQFYLRKRLSSGAIIRRDS